MNGSDETLAVDDQANPKGGQPTSFTQTTRNWYRKHKPKIQAAGAIGLAAVGSAIALLADRQHAEERDDSELETVPSSAGTRRRPPGPHDVDPFLRRLPDGQRASATARANYKAATGKDLPPGYTYVNGW